MRNTTRRLFGAAALLALSATGLLGGTASASPGAPEENDGRATLVEGNIDIDQKGDACDVVGLPGDERVMPAGTFDIEGFNITITAHPEGYVVTGVVVKGGSAYNVYDAEDLGELAWEDLRPPVNSSGGPAGISHWFVCAEKDDSVTTTPSTPDSTTPSTPVTTTDEVAPTTTTTTTTESVAVTPTSTSAPVMADGGDNGDLANTGYDGGWMLFVGLGLVAAGAAFVASPKLRGLLRR